MSSDPPHLTPVGVLTAILIEPLGTPPRPAPSGLLEDDLLGIRILYAVGEYPPSPSATED